MKPLIKIRSREDIIKTDLKGIWFKRMDWFNVAQDTDKLRPVVGTLMNLGVPYMRLP
jgi:hypothetical protein